ncbi:GGDEF domain-containing protein [Halomonas beimenensis]|uniref:diguanylate cyclase n=1 Tax=Halomonas beimenensis TaxID=475662 RepID=A0A291PAZ1_9GAMM|nr:diguanylate cyclase [Halomonas beimenensis]ATJ84060.1 hypothetical protein BEI_3073 [Halomonas beimenensis]
MPLTATFDIPAPTLRPHRVKVRHYRKYILLLVATPLGALLHASFVPVFWLMEQSWLAAFNLASVFVWGAAFLANRFGRHTLSVCLAALEAATHASLVSWWLGTGAGFHYYLWPVGCLVVLAPRMRARFSAPFGFAFLGLFTLLETLAGTPTGPTLSPTWLTVLPAVNIALSAVCLIVLAVIVRAVNENQERHLTRLATRDALTGLYNRHFTLDFLRQLAERNRRSGERCALVLADVDHFKAINDRYGHEIGDTCLIRVADQLRAQFRASDCLCRWGGEEFLILLPATGGEYTQGILERFSHALRASPLETPEGLVRPTMSFGATEMLPGESFETAIERADRLLYRAKAEGRDRIVSDTP